MTNTNQMIRTLLIYGICLPLAVFLGYMLTNPLGQDTLVLVALVFGVLVFPLVLRWHHPMLFVTWNTTIVIFLLPGSPNLWMLMAAVSFMVSRIQAILNKNAPPLRVPSLTRPILFLGAVVLLTALLTGGVGFKSLGAETGGGRRYAQVFGALIGYFALSAYRIPLGRANRYLALFFLGGLTMAVGSLSHLAPSWARILFAFFPADSMLSDFGVARGSGIFRSYGLAAAGTMGLFYMLARYGVEGSLGWRHLWRSVCFIGFTLAMLAGGFRSSLLLFLGVYLFQFYLEGLHKGPRLAIFAGIGCLFALVVLSFSTHMPSNIQRVVSVFGVPVTPEVEMDARASSEWRMEIWREVLPQVPQYFWLGKGYGVKVNELDFSSDLMRSGAAYDQTAVAKLAQDYHSGPLSVILPFGIWGLIGMIWFFVASLKVFIANYRFGVPQLKLTNTLLLAAFMVKSAFFLILFGSFQAELAWFAGILGLSVAFNHGVAQKAMIKAPQPTAADESKQPKAQPPRPPRPGPLRPALP